MDCALGACSGHLQRAARYGVGSFEFWINVYDFAPFGSDRNLKLFLTFTDHIQTNRQDWNVICPCPTFPDT